MKPMFDMVAVTVARGRSVQASDGTHGPGSSLDMAADEAAFLAERGFVTLAGQETVERRTICVEDTAPGRIGLQTGARPSWEEDLAASRRGAP
ncbi:MAG: hypothetical protein ACRYHQ_15485 [Janthinobacterium lividum]